MELRVVISRKLILALLVTSSVVADQSANRKQYRTIESYMNSSVDPCTDFYEYACGNWDTVHRYAYYADSLGFVDYQVNEEYEHILKHRSRAAHRQNHFVRQVLYYYNSCKSVEEFLPKLYIDWMKQHENVTWPSIEENNKNDTFDWLYMLATLRKYGFNGVFLTESVQQPRYDSRHFLISIDRPTKDDEFVAFNYQQFKTTLQYMGIDKMRKQRQLWNTFHDFESKILKLYEIEDDKDVDDEIKLSELDIPELERYLKIVLDIESLDSNMSIAVTNRPYIRALFKLLENNDDKFICDYIMIRFLRHCDYDGPTGFSKNECISHVREQLPLAMAWLYEEHNPMLIAETERIERMFEILRTHFLKTLNNNPNHFDSKVLEFLNKKLKNMQLKVGNLPRNDTIAFIEEFYRDLMLSENEFYANHLKLLRLNTIKEHEQLNSTLPLNAQDFYYLADTRTLALSSPYFVQRINSVIMPLTLLHWPLYHPQLHDIFKYSLIGFLLAHEITHGFDDSGLDYDQYGNFRATSEIIPDNSVFDSNFDCLYDKNPKVIDEKIADVSGLRWAFGAYFSNTTEMKQTLPSWKMPQDQLFFRSFALFFCSSNSTDKSLINSPHGTWRSRLIDTVTQFPEFGQVYDCPVGSPMNPERKCQLWR